MKCPYCGELDTRVIDSRATEEDTVIRRRRVCEACGKRFTTYEKMETIPMIIMKKDNNREAYDRAKLERGVLRACYKRPISAEQIQKTVDAVETRILNSDMKEMKSADVGEIVMDELKKLDEVAYVRFASVYREFKDSNTFLEELKKVLDGGAKK
ncbi:MAG: transcriptional regulator NrdR [Lachnospiraceae bacterium]|jgi:transcriptional repressor NrdR|nr:transcriptional regulator NrdR [Lachnospiraceae bacterium]